MVLKMLFVTKVFLAVHNSKALYNSKCHHSEPSCSTLCSTSLCRMYYSNVSNFDQTQQMLISEYLCELAPMFRFHYNERKRNRRKVKPPPKIFELLWILEMLRQEVERPRRRRLDYERVFISVYQCVISFLISIFKTFWLFTHAQSRLCMNTGLFHNFYMMYSRNQHHSGGFPLKSFSVYLWIVSS